MIYVIAVEEINGEKKAYGLANHRGSCVLWEYRYEQDEVIVHQGLVPLAAFTQSIKNHLEEKKEEIGEGLYEYSPKRIEAAYALAELIGEKRK